MDRQELVQVAASDTGTGGRAYGCVKLDTVCGFHLYIGEHSGQCSLLAFSVLTNLYKEVIRVCAFRFGELKNVYGLGVSVLKRLDNLLEDSFLC